MAPTRLLLLTVPMLSLLRPASCQRTLLGGKSDYLDQISYDIVIGQLKQRILHGLNRSEPPQVTPAQPHTRSAQVNVPRLLLLSSQAGDFQRQDVISFMLDSCLSSHAQDIQEALLVFRVRSIQEHHPGVRGEQPGSVRDTTSNCRFKKKSLGSRRRHWLSRRKLVESYTVTNTVAVTGNNRSSGRFFRFGKRDSVHNLTAYRAPVDVHHNDVSREEADVHHNDVRREEADVPRVKIVVRVMNTTTDRKRNIALQEVEVKRTTGMLVSVPTKYLRRAAENTDHKLTLQIVCRRCGQRTWVESVYKSRRRHGIIHDRNKDRSRFLSPNRPYMYLDMSSSTCIDRSWRSQQQNSHSHILEAANSSVGARGENVDTGSGPPQHEEKSDH